MARTRLTVSEAVAEAGDFARSAWRDCWAVMLIVIVGQTLVFMGAHAAETDWRPWIWPKLGALLTIAYVPLFGALYRLGVGGEPTRSLGPGGLQWTGVEWRLLCVWAVLAFILGLGVAPIAIVSAPLIYFFRHHAVALGPLGSWSVATLILAPFWLVFGSILLRLWGRLGLAGSITTARGRISPLSGWSMTRGLGWTIGLAWLVVQIPTLGGWLALMAMNLIEADDLAAGAHAVWPLPEAIGAGAVMGILSAAVQLPLSVGLLTGVYCLLKPSETGQDETGDAAAAATAALSAHEAGEHRDQDGDANAFDALHQALAEQEARDPASLSPWPHSVLPPRPLAAPTPDGPQAPETETREPEIHEHETHAPKVYEPQDEPHAPLAPEAEAEQSLADAREPHV